MENVDIEYFRLANYTYDREFFIMTTNATEDGHGWECCVFVNNPETNTRDFESLVECLKFTDESQAKKIHTDMLYKWNVLGTESK